MATAAEADPENEDRYQARLREAVAEVVKQQAHAGMNEYYPSEKDYIYAIADALREECPAIHQAGLLFQVDDAVLAGYALLRYRALCVTGRRLHAKRVCRGNA